MDQDSFRQLLQTSNNAGSSEGTSRGSLLSVASKAKTLESSKPAFKPRKVKKSLDSRYRDRAAERRVGGGNDYAQVEAVLDDFTKRTADITDKSLVEEQRRYLGGDGDHSILVKGLDIALLEQNKARAAQSTVDDETLEQAFLEASATAQKKRTREDIIRELKEKRVSQQPEVDASAKSAEEEARLLEEAKKKGKFRPIGFKPIGSAEESKGKKKRTRDEPEKKKKKRKIDYTESKANGEVVAETLPLKAPAKPNPTIEDPEPEPEPNLDLDIFADAGEYQGIDLGEDEDDEKDDNPMRGAMEPELEEGEEPNVIQHRWIRTEEDSHPSVNNPKEQKDSANVTPPHQSHQSDRRQLTPENVEEGEEEEEQPMRLVPLASSALPSIKEFLAMEKAATAQDQKKKRKDKKKGASGGDSGAGGLDGEEGKKRSAEAKADRDYKRLKSYTDKKAAASGSK